MEVNNNFKFSRCPIRKFNPYEFFRHGDVANKEFKLFKSINCEHEHYDHKYTNNELNSIYEAEYANGYIEETDLSRVTQIPYKEDVNILKKLNSKL